MPEIRRYDKDGNFKGTMTWEQLYQFPPGSLKPVRFTHGDRVTYYDIQIEETMPDDKR